MKTVMVTGSRGYIGTNLCKMLITLGYNVIQLDRKVNSDIFHTDLWNYDPDVIVHLAAIASITECEEFKENAILDNVLATQIISNYAHEREIPVIFASSAAIYDTSSVYGMTKYIGEKMFLYFNDYVILRFSNAYGGENFINNTENQSVIAKWVRNYRAELPLIINGSGSQTRDFIHVDDINRVIVKCIDEEITHKIMDVGTGEQTSMIELSRMFPNARTEFDYYGLVGVQDSVAKTDGMDRIKVYPTISVEDYLKDIL